MNVLLLYILAGSGAALVLAIPIGAGLARILALTPPWRRPADFSVTTPSDIASVVRLDGASEQAIAKLISTVETAGTLILRARASGKQLGVLMSTDRFELLHGKELIVDDPVHMRSLLASESDGADGAGVTLDEVLPG